MRFNILKKRKRYKIIIHPETHAELVVADDSNHTGYQSHEKMSNHHNTQIMNSSLATSAICWRQNATARRPLFWVVALMINTVHTSVFDALFMDSFAYSCELPDAWIFQIRWKQYSSQKEDKKKYKCQLQWLWSRQKPLGTWVGSTSSSRQESPLMYWVSVNAVWVIGSHYPATY